MFLEAWNEFAKKSCSTLVWVMCRRDIEMWLCVWKTHLIDWTPLPKATVWYPLHRCMEWVYKGLLLPLPSVPPKGHYLKGNRQLLVDSWDIFQGHPENKRKYRFVCVSHIAVFLKNIFSWNVLWNLLLLMLHFWWKEMLLCKQISVWLCCSCVTVLCAYRISNMFQASCYMP